MLRTIVADDEPPARERIHRLLEPEADVELVASCKDGQEAVTEIERLAPDLVFLDIRMPKLDGFEVLEALAVDALPAVVFVTAFDEYAMPAFQIHATDYLLKPVQRDRLREALDRVRQRRVEEGDDGLRRGLLELLETLRRRRGGSSKLWIRSKGRILALDTAQIEWVDGAANYVRIHSAGGTHRLRHTLSSLEAKLGSNRFQRIHRSTIVNIDAIVELVPHSSGELVAIMRNGQRLSVSRSYRRLVKSFHAGAA